MWQKQSEWFPSYEKIYGEKCIMKTKRQHEEIENKHRHQIQRNRNKITDLIDLKKIFGNSDIPKANRK
ncbi:Hypothetical predicted protein [Octopus vulgaris]|uniref:Uncharacterized protein n=1 Tax=Octopus vulgaris TaxID=6645 RepID=A0AA36F185_OCTVU|nr:Hypothetical predicted protein [Octopus vulgaris]